MAAVLVFAFEVQMTLISERSVSNWSGRARIGHLLRRMVWILEMNSELDVWIGVD